MFEIEEELLENLADEYDVGIDTVRDYAVTLLNCELLKDEETYERVLENAVSMVNPIIAKPIKQEEVFERRSKKDILSKVLEITFIHADEDEIEDSVNKMIKLSEEKRR